MNWREYVLNLKNNNYFIYSKHKDNTGQRELFKQDQQTKAFQVKTEQSEKPTVSNISGTFSLLLPLDLKSVPIFQKSTNNISIFNVIFHILQNQVTPWSRVLPKKLTGLQLVKKFPTFYRTQRFITAFTRALTFYKTHTIYFLCVLAAELQLTKISVTAMARYHIPCTYLLNSEIHK
jgi:hypothetical protein